MAQKITILFFSRVFPNSSPRYTVYSHREGWPFWGTSTQWGWGIDWSGLTGICNQIDRFTPRLSDMIGRIYGLKYLWSIKLMFCESKSRPRQPRGLDLTCRVESVSHSNCVAIQKYHVIFGDLSGHTSNSRAAGVLKGISHLYIN